MKTKILIAILTVGAFSVSTMKAQEKPMKMKQDTMKMDHSKMNMMDKSVEVEIKHELMEIDNMYTCPMHGDVKSDKPGACPKCGMDLQKMENTKKQQCCGGMKMECDSTKMGMDHSKMEMKHDSIKMAKAYTCQMHSDEVSDKPGECSKCGKTLVTKQMNLKNNSIKAKHAKVVETYFCDMHPSEVSDNSGKCPKCGMDLKKMDVEKKDIPKKHKHQ